MKGLKSEYSTTCTQPPAQATHRMLGSAPRPSYHTESRKWSMHSPLLQLVNEASVAKRETHHCWEPGAATVCGTISFSSCSALTCIPTQIRTHDHSRLPLTIFTCTCDYLSYFANAYGCITYVRLHLLNTRLYLASCG